MSIHNATLLSYHFRKIATVSHFQLVLIKMSSDDMNYNEYLVVEEFLENDDLDWISIVR